MEYLFIGFNLILQIFMQSIQLAKIVNQNLPKNQLAESLLQSILGRESVFDYLYTLCREIATIDRQYQPHVDTNGAADAFFSQIQNNNFLPSPSILTSGMASFPTLLTSTALQLDDNVERIFEKLKDASILLQHGIQVSVDFSKLRASRIKISSNHKQSLGPIPYMELFTHTPQGGYKSNLRFILNFNHADIVDFINFISTAPSNIRFTLGITNDFMNALRNKSDFLLKHQFNSEGTKKINANALYK